MVKNSSSQNGSAFVVIIIILTVATIGALGFVFWQNFTQLNDTTNNGKKTQETVKQGPEKLCANSSDNVEVGGVFCSEDVGVEFKVPEIFKGKFQKTENYNITEGSMENFQGNPAGKSIAAYEAVIASDRESLTLTVAAEPIRSGYSSVDHALQRTYFNATDDNLHLVNSPANNYDSATDTTTTTGSISEGRAVPFFEAGQTKVFQGKIGDAGTVQDGYLMDVNDHLVVIKIKHAANPMEEPAINSSKSFTELNSYLKQLKVLK